MRDSSFFWVFFNCSYLNVAYSLLSYAHNNQTVQTAEKWVNQLWMRDENFYSRPQEKETERVAFWTQEHVPIPHFHHLGDYNIFLPFFSFSSDKHLFLYLRIDVGQRCLLKTVEHKSTNHVGVSAIMELRWCNIFASVIGKISLLIQNFLIYSSVSCSLEVSFSCLESLKFVSLPGTNKSEMRYILLCNLLSSALKYKYCLC